MGPHLTKMRHIFIGQLKIMQYKFYVSLPVLYKMSQEATTKKSSIISILFICMFVCYCSFSLFVSASSVFPQFYIKLLSTVN
jgi:uncharacterized membrane protein (DUF485 family)